MRNEAPWNIIIKYFQNLETKEERGELEKWLAKDKQNGKLFAEAFQIYTLASGQPGSLHPDPEKAWMRIRQRIANPVHPLNQWFRKVKYSAAAVLLMLIGFSAFWLYKGSLDDEILQQYTQITAPLGQKTQVLLPDSSQVWLNSGSTLKYQGDFNLKRREVLLNGEAFFEVKKNRSKMFRVKTGKLNVDVYGTAFNVKNYQTDDFQEITISEGLVGISGANKEIRKLTAGEQALLNNETNKISFTEINPEVVSSWRNNELIFDNTPLEEAIKYLERWYGVQITIDRAMRGKHKYTFKIKTESLKEMLELMKVMTPLEYEIDGKNVRIRYSN